MRRMSGLLVFALILILASADSPLVRARADQDVLKVRPNYELASRWTASKVTNKMIFTSAVSPN